MNKLEEEKKDIRMKRDSDIMKMLTIIDCVRTRFAPNAKQKNKLFNEFLNDLKVLVEIMEIRIDKK